MFEEKLLEYVDCGKQVKKVVLEESDTDNFLCPHCESAEIASEEF